MPRRLLLTDILPGLVQAEGREVEEQRGQSLVSVVEVEEEEEGSNINNEKSSQESPQPLPSPSYLLESKPPSQVHLCHGAHDLSVPRVECLVQVFLLLVFLVREPVDLVNVPLVKYP